METAHLLLKVGLAHANGTWFCPLISSLGALTSVHLQTKVCKCISECVLRRMGRMDRKTYAWIPEQKIEPAAIITGSLTPKQWRQQPFHNELVKYDSETQLDESETFDVSTNGTAGEIYRLRHMHKLITISC